VGILVISRRTLKKAVMMIKGWKQMAKTNMVFVVHLTQKHSSKLGYKIEKQ
jgi:hypothetical protein